MTEAVTLTWLVAASDVDPAPIEAWCREVTREHSASTFLQVGTGRGLLASGAGALIIGRAPALEEASPEWATSWHSAEFRLRQVHAPTIEPDPTVATAILLTRTYVPADTQDEFRRWLETEHSQRQLDVPGNHWYRGYEELGERHSFMNLWGLDEAAVADGEAWDRARLTPWRERMVPAMKGMDRAFYRPVATAEG